MNKTLVQLAAFTLTAVLTLSLGPPVWAAEQKPLEPTQQQLAQMLYSLGLFQGTDQGFELERPMTRGEAAAMVTRFFGGEEEALEQNQPAPFDDVPGWAVPYVGWLYRNGLTQGVSQTKYGSEQQISFAQFAVMLNRRLDSGASYEQCVEYGCRVASQEQMAQGDRPILRGEAAELAAGSLCCTAGGDSQNLAMALMEQGVFTLETWEKAAASVWEYDYVDRRAEGETGAYWIEKQLQGVTIAQSQTLPGQPVLLCRLGGGKSLYTVRQGEQISLYSLDEAVMELNQVGQAMEGRYAWQWGWQGDFYYFAVETQEGGLRFYRADTQSCQLVQDKGLASSFSKGEKYNGTYRLRSLRQGLFLCCLEGLCRVNQAGDGLEQLIGGGAVRDVASQGDEIYYTTFVLQQTEYGWEQRDGAQILRLEEGGRSSVVFDGQAWGLHPNRFSRAEGEKIYFFADDQTRRSPKGERYYEYCWDGRRVSVSRSWINGRESADFAGEQLRLDGLYQELEQ